MRSPFAQILVAVARGLGSYLSLVIAFVSLAWIALRLEAVPVLHWGPWENSAGTETPLVILDAGHGGHDGGAVAHDMVEKVTALQLAKRVSYYLAAQGVLVKMTRTTDVFIPLERRSAIANEEKAAAFVSLHLNTGVDAPDVSGIETYYSNRKAPFLPRALPGETAPAPPLPAQNAQGETLARCVQQHACLASRAQNRGIKERGYSVVLHTLCPAVLVECGFLTHAAEAAKLKREDYRDRLAQGIALGIAEFLKTQPLRAAPDIPVSVQTPNIHAVPATEPDP